MLIIIALNYGSPFPTTMSIAPSAIEQTGNASDYKIRRSTTQTCYSCSIFWSCYNRSASMSLYKIKSWVWRWFCRKMWKGGTAGAFMSRGSNEL